VRGCWGHFIAAGVLAAWLPGAWAQAGIYTCVDAKGRRLTSDRPILDCLDREQTELSSSGKVVRKLGPSLTGEERAIEEEKQRLDLLAVRVPTKAILGLAAAVAERLTHQSEKQMRAPGKK